MPTIEDAIQHIRMGNRAEGRALLEDLLDADENNQEIWLWLSTVVDSDDDREICLENVLALNPKNVAAKRGLEALRSGIFDTDDLLRDLMEDTGPESSAPPTTFLDDFAIGADDVDDNELLLPREARKRAKKKSGGINMRLVILALLAVGVVVVLGALAVASMFFGGNGGGGDSQPTAAVPQESPAQNQQAEPTAAPTDTPTPGPTDTPTATATPRLQLPTPKPTDLPTPIATRVVSPTPIR